MITHRDIATEELSKLIEKYKPIKVLEIGAGLNSFKELFNAEEYITIDDCSQYKGDSIKMDAHNLQFEDDIFDCVFMCHVAEHFLNPLQAFSEIRRVLRKGGVLISITPNCCEHQILKGDPDHFFVLNPFQQLRLMATTNFSNYVSYTQTIFEGRNITKEQDYNIFTIAVK